MAAKQATEERELLGNVRNIHASNNKTAMFSVGSCRGVINETRPRVFSSVWRPWPVGKGVSSEAEECPLLEAVAGKQLVKTLQAGKDLVCALVISKMWTSAIAL
jgi:hypothetical protein